MQEQRHRRWGSQESTLPAGGLSAEQISHVAMGSGILEPSLFSQQTERSAGDRGKDGFNESAFSKRFWRGFPDGSFAPAGRLHGFTETHLWQ